MTAVRAVCANTAGAANGHQPSPYLTTRFRAADVLPPIQIGGCGVLTGLGCAVMPEAFYQGKIATAAFFAANMLPALTTVRHIVEHVDDEIMQLSEAAF